MNRYATTIAADTPKYTRNAGRPASEVPSIWSPPAPSAANPKFAHNYRESDCELRGQSGTRIIDLLVSFDSEVRIGASCKLGRTSESGHWTSLDVRKAPLRPKPSEAKVWFSLWPRPGRASTLLL